MNEIKATHVKRIGKPPVQMVCAHCGIDFLTWPYRLNLQVKFCSRECSSAGMRKPQVELVCEHCKARFTVPQRRAQVARFCSHGCAFENMRTQVAVRALPEPNARTGPETIDRDCEYCGKAFQALASKVRFGKGRHGRFCSLYCSRFGRRKLSIKTRFWSKVNKSGQVPLHVPELGCCWVWMARIEPSGYGSFAWRHRDSRSAHRASWALEHGPIPEQACVLHKCDNRRCVRPDHLFLGSHYTNMADAKSKGRTAHGERHAAARITDARAREIIHTKTGCAKLAAKFGVSISTVHSVRKRKTWKHVTP